MSLSFKSKLKYVFCAVFAILWLVNSNAQEPSYRNYNVEQGLPSSEVYRVLQDSKGYIWFATDGGVCKFDGTNFKTYTTKDGLCDNTILHLFEDVKGRIWCYTFSGKFSYFFNDSIYNLPTNEKLVSIYRYYSVNSVYVDQNDTIWLGLIASGGQSVYKLTVDGKYMGVEKQDTVGKNNSFFIQQLSEKGFINGCTAFKQDLENISFFDQKHTKKLIPISNSQFHSSIRTYFIKLKNGDFVVSLKNKIILFNEKGIKQTRELKDVVISLYEDNDENIWAGVFRNGAIKIEKKHRQSFEYETYLDGKSVTSVYQDKEGGFWFSTLDAGAFYTSALYFHLFNKESGLTHNKIYGLAVSKKGTVAFTLQNRDVFELSATNQKAQKINMLQYLPEGQIHFDQEDNLWVKCFGNLIIMNRQKNTINIYPNKGGTCYYNDNDTVLEGSTHGIYNYYKFKHNYGTCNYHANIKVNAICRRDSIIFAGALNGLWTVSSKGFKRFENAHPLFKNRINDIKIDKNKNLWMASKGAGLIIYTNNKQVYQITEKQGLVNDLCNAIAIDSAGVVWVGTNNGLSKIVLSNGNIQKYTIENYNTSNGLVSNQITNMVVYQNDIWLGTNSGITVFNSKNLKLNTTAPPIIINSVSANDKHVLLKPIPVFSNTTNNIEFSYSGLAYKNAGKIRYKYTLNGLDTTLVYTNNSVIRFAELPHGAYTFKVWACNNDGLWSSKPAAFLFIIKPAFYQTKWFLFITVLLGIGLVVLIVRYSNKRIREKGLLTQRITESEQKALRAQMNPHFIFNSLNSIQKFIMKNDKLLASDYLSKFSNLMRAILDNSQELYIPLEDELNSLNLYMELESLRFEDKFDYIIDVSEEVDIYSTVIPSMLIQPYVENAIKHGLSTNELKGDIKIVINKEKDGILYTIKDNGIGREKAAMLKVANHRSHGLKITQERIDALNMYRKHKITLEIIDLYTTEKIASGTQVELYIPDSI